MDNFDLSETDINFLMNNVFVNPLNKKQIIYRKSTTKIQIDSYIYTLMPSEKKDIIIEWLKKQPFYDILKIPQINYNTATPLWKHRLSMIELNFRKLCSENLQSKWFFENGINALHVSSKYDYNIVNDFVSMLNHPQGRIEYPLNLFIKNFYNIKWIPSYVIFCDIKTMVDKNILPKNSIILNENILAFKEYTDAIYYKISI
jgi:hypothetical protein